MKTTQRETFDEWWIGRLRFQFFEPMLWRWGWRLLRTDKEISLALPTGSVTWVRRER